MVSLDPTLTEEVSDLNPAIQNTSFASTRFYDRSRLRPLYWGLAEIRKHKVVKAACATSMGLTLSGSSNSHYEKQKPSLTKTGNILSRYASVHLSYRRLQRVVSTYVQWKGSPHISVRHPASASLRLSTMTPGHSDLLLFMGTPLLGGHSDPIFEQD